MISRGSDQRGLDRVMRGGGRPTSGRRFAADPSRAAHVCMRASDGRRSVHVLVCVTAYVAGACDLCRVVSGSLRSLGCLCVCVVGKCVHVCVMVHAVRGLHRRSAFKHTVLAGSAGGVNRMSHQLPGSSQSRHHNVKPRVVIPCVRQGSHTRMVLRGRHA